MVSYHSWTTYAYGKYDYVSHIPTISNKIMKNKLAYKLMPYALKFRAWSRGKTWIQIPLWIFILWLLGFANPYWCVYPVCWIQGS